MKLSIKLAGLLGSGVFILTSLPGLYQHVKPTDMSMFNVQGVVVLESLLTSVAGAVIAGIIGYWMGDILSKPKGPSPKQRAKAALKRSAAKNTRPITGEETFLDDLDSVSDPAIGKSPVSVETSALEAE